MKIPHADLAPETLTRLISEFVSRDGTDYGETETPHESKIAQVRSLLQKGEVVIVFDADSESCNIVSARDAEKNDSGGAQD